MKKKPTEGFVVLCKNIDYSIILNAFRWVRAKHQIPEWRRAYREFDTEFKCRSTVRYTGTVDTIEFASEHDYLVFVLRWS